MVSGPGMKKTSEPQKISKPDQKNEDQRAVSTESPGLFFHHNTNIQLNMLTMEFSSYLLEIPNEPIPRYSVKTRVTMS